MQNGLSVGIINPGSEDMMKAWYAFHALMALDSNCEKYIARYAQQPERLRYRQQAESIR